MKKHKLKIAMMDNERFVSDSSIIEKSKKSRKNATIEFPLNKFGSYHETYYG